MAIPLVAVAAKITAAIVNAIIVAVNFQGETIIVPTVSGTGVAVNAKGQVVLTNATAFVCSGVFSNYNNVRAVIDIPTTSSPTILSLQLATGGVADTTATNYDTVSNGGAATNAANWPMLGGVRAAFTAWLNFFGASRALPTRMSGLVAAYNAAGASGASNTLANNHRASTAYDGLAGAFSGGFSGSGTITFYGSNTGA